MSTKHNVPKTGSRSRYRERLAARGLTKAPMMPFINDRGHKGQTPGFILSGAGSRTEGEHQKTARRGNKR